MNFLLKNLEVSLSESHLVVGEKLFDDQKVAVLYESERNLWIAEVDGFEIEMQISPSRVKACSCECPVFQKERMCSHVAAGLLALRKHLSEKKTTDDSPKKTYQKLTINAILDQVDKEELSAFVRFYANSNRPFAISLKTRFAAKVPMPNDSEKYRQVVASVLKSAFNKNGKMSVAGAKQLLAIGFDLLGQANDSLALDHYKECWSVLSVLIEKIIPVLNRTDFEASRFQEFTERCFDLAGPLTTRPIPPALRSEVWVFLMEIVNRPIYRGYDVAAYFYRLLLPLADDKSMAIQLLHVVDHELKNSHTLSEAYLKELVSIKLAILQKRGFAKIAKTYFKEVLSSPESVLTNASTALEKGMLDIAEMLAKNGLQLSENPLYQLKVKLLLLDIAVANKNAASIVKWSKDCYIQTGNIKYVRLCKQFYQGDWSVFHKELAKNISVANPVQQLEYLANLFGEEKCIPDLADIARKEGTVDFLMKYDHYFLPDHAQQLYGLYLEILDRYFSNHLGIKPTKKMLALFDHLRQLNADRLVGKLAGFIRKNYPERLELAIEIMAS